jgi:hypothetical protein
MSDNYQAVYDAVRSRIGNVDIGSVVESVIGRNTDISQFVARLVEGQYIVRHQFEQTAEAMRRPFVLLRPKIYPDGDKWCALYGDDIITGVAGFGATPEEAAAAFDVAWLSAKVQRLPTLKELGFSTRTRNMLDVGTQRAWNEPAQPINTTAELLQRSAEDLLGIMNFGEVCLREVRGKLAEHGLKLRDD